MAKPPIIWSGARSKLLTGEDLQLQNGGMIHYNGQQNFINNGHFEVNTQGWTVNSGAVLAITTDPDEIPEGKSAGQVTNPGAANAFISYPFYLTTRSTAHRDNNRVTVSFTIKTAAGYVAGDAQVETYDADGAVTNDTFAIPASTPNGQRFVLKMDVSNNNNFQLRFRSVTASIEYYISNISVTETQVEVGQTISGLVASAGQLKGTNTDDNAATGYVGEHVEFLITTTTALTAASGTFEDVGGITLSAGDWDVDATVVIGESVGFPGGTLEIGIQVLPLGAASIAGVTNLSNRSFSGALFNYGSLVLNGLRVQSDGTDLTVAGVTTAGTQQMRILILGPQYAVSPGDIRGLRLSARRRR